jgi:hypothetical protein
LGQGFGGYGVPFSAPVHQGVLPYNHVWGQNVPFGCNVPCPVPGVTAPGFGVNNFGVGSLPYSPINAINPFTTLNPVNCGPLGCTPFNCPPYNCPPYNCLPINGLPYSMINPVTGFSPVNPISSLPYVNPIAGLTHPGIVGQTSSLYGGLPFPTNQFSPSVPFAGVNPLVNPILSTLNSFGASTNFSTPWSNFANTSPLSCFGSVPFGGLGCGVPQYGLGVNPYLSTPFVNPLMVNPYLQGLGLWPSTQIPGLHTQGIQGQAIKTHNGVITPNGVSTTVPFPGAYIPNSAFPFPVAPFHSPIHGGLTGYSPAYTPAVAGVGCEIA